MKHLEKYGEEYAWHLNRIDKLNKNIDEAKMVFEALDIDELQDIIVCIDFWNNVNIQCESYTKAKLIIKTLCETKGFIKKDLLSPTFNGEKYSIHWRFTFDGIGQTVPALLTATVNKDDEDFKIEYITGDESCTFEVEEKEVKSTEYVLKCNANGGH